MEAVVPISIDEPSFLLSYDLILTPNQRLSMQLSSAYDDKQQTLGEKSWQPLQVYSMTNWLENQWNDAVAAGLKPCVGLRVLGPDEELELWRQAVSHCYSGVLLAKESAAQQIMRAWQTLVHWQVNLDAVTQSTFAFYEDHSFFLECVVHFENLSLQQNAVAACQLAGILSTLPAPFSGKVLLYEFEEIMPVHKHLLAVWRLSSEPGIAVHGDSAFNKDASGTALEFSSRRQELHNAAEWAKATVECDPDASVAVIVPDLNGQRDLVQDVFLQVFNPAYELPKATRPVQQFNISAGQSLASQPLVEHALSVLELNFRELEVEALPALLYSPFLSTLCSDTHEERSELEYRLRNYRSQTVSLSTIVYEASFERKSVIGPKQSCPALSRTFSFFRQFLAGKSAMLAPQWLELFAQQLQACGWPGARNLDSIEHQQFQHWQEVLINCQRLASLRHGADAPVTALQCFELLTQCCREHIFQAKSVPSRVQVLGLLEGAGMLFTHTWLSNMGTQFWPAPARPSAYIPIELQRKYRMPHCDAERELQFSGRLFANYRSHCRDLIMSYVGREGDTVAPASPFLLSNAADVRSIEPPCMSSVVDQVTEPYELVTELVVTDAEQLSAVAAIYEDQAACGFKAFARHRLRLRPPEKAGYGLDGRDRGMLLHDSMEAVWRELGGTAALKACNSTGLNDVINRSVDSAIELTAKRVRFRDSAVFLDLERQRLQTLIARWLEFESARGEFSVVEFEVRLEAQIAGRDATLRIDRVDRKSDGRLVLIEYKTGVISEASVLSQPPHSPQLPLYISAFGNNDEEGAELASGGVLCRIDSHEPTWLGFGAGAEEDLPRHLKQQSNKVPEWSVLREFWQQGLDSLENKFLSGQIKAEPIKGLQTCRLCDYGSICRFALQESTARHD